jgi:LmbE family N-acetylglucosaminyl deacetylase
MTKNNMPKQKVLIVEAHSDDSAISATGLMEKFKGKYEYHFVLMSVSEIYLHHLERKITREERMKEYENYVNYFNGTWHKNTVVPFDSDARMDLLPKAQIVRALEDVIGEVKPDVMICQGPSFHHDHTITYEAMIAATRPTARHCPTTMLIMENPTYVHSVGPSTDFKPEFYCSLTEEQIDKKIDIFSTCFPSQIRKGGNYLSPESLKAWAKYRGMECRREYAEAFHMYKMVV